MIVFDKVLPAQLVGLQHHGLQRVVGVGLDRRSSDGVAVLVEGIILEHDNEMVAGNKTEDFVVLIDHWESRVAAVVQNFDDCLHLLALSETYDILRHQVLSLQELTVGGDGVLEHGDLLGLDGHLVERRVENASNPDGSDGTDEDRNEQLNVFSALHHDDSDGEGEAGIA